MLYEAQKNWHFKYLKRVLIADSINFFFIRFITVRNQLPVVKLRVRTNVAIYVLNYKIYFDWTYELNTIWPRPNGVICLSNTAMVPSEKRNVNFFCLMLIWKTWCQNVVPVHNLSEVNYLFIPVWFTLILTFSKWKYFFCYVSLCV